MTLRGRRALVTGAASGIGRAAAILLAERGAEVAVADVDEGGGRATVESIRGCGGSTVFERLDVSDSAAVGRVVSRVRPDVVFNCAGLVSGQPDFPDTAPERLVRLIAVNVVGTMLVTRAAIRHMAAHRGGAVVNVASTAALLSDHPDPVYGASKAAVKAFTEQCAREAHARGVRVNAVLPGAVDTPIIAKTGDGRAPAGWLRPRLDEIELLTPGAIAQAMIALAVEQSRVGECVVIANR